MLASFQSGGGQSSAGDWGPFYGNAVKKIISFLQPDDLLSIREYAVGVHDRDSQSLPVLWAYGTSTICDSRSTRASTP